MKGQIREETCRSRDFVGPQVEIVRTTKNCAAGSLLSLGFLSSKARRPFTPHVPPLRTYTSSPATSGHPPDPTPTKHLSPVVGCPTFLQTGGIGAAAKMVATCSPFRTVIGSRTASMSSTTSSLGGTDRASTDARYASASDASGGSTVAWRLCSSSPVVVAITTTWCITTLSMHPSAVARSCSAATSIG